jgi:hypothetical protein
MQNDIHAAENSNHKRENKNLLETCTYQGVNGG